MSEVWVALAAAAVSAGGAAYSANQQSKNANKAAGAVAANQVTPPNVNKQYKEGVANQYLWGPMFAQQEMDLRKQFAPQQAQLAGDIYGPLLQKLAGANMRTLRTIDPESIEGRKQLYGNVSRDLGFGTGLSPELLLQSQQDIRAAQTARGHITGNAATTAEAAYTARDRETMYQQRIANMMNFLRGPTPEDHFGKLAGAGAGVLGLAAGGAVTPGYQYVSPPTNVGAAFAAGATGQFGMASGNATQLGGVQAGAAMAQQNPWAAALAAAAGSATESYNKGGFSGGTVASDWRDKYSNDWQSSARGAAGRAA